MSLPNPNFRPVYESPITTLDGAIDNTQSTITLTSVADIGSHPNILIIWETGKREIVKYDTAPTGNVLTVERGYGDSTANSFGSGASVSRLVSYLDIENLQLNQEFLEGKLPVGDVVGTSDVQTLTGKVIDGDDNTIQDLSYSAIKATSRSGNDVTLITGTKGTDGNLAKWNADGDLVDSKTPPTGDIVGTTDAQIVTNKTIDANSNSITNIGSSEIDEDIITGLTELATTADNSDLLLIYDTDVTTLKKIAISNLPSSGGGESNTASNVGTAGVGIFHQKNGVDLEFKKINAGSNKVTITDDTTNDEVDVDIAESNIVHQNLSGSGTNDHSAIDSHIANVTTNPHSVDKTNVGLSNVTNDSQLKRSSGDINSFDEKITPIGDDIIIIEDSNETYAKKKVKISNLPSGGGGDITTDDAWVAAGDLIVGTGENTASILTLGDSGKYLKSDGSTVAYSNIAESDVTNLVTDLGNKAPLASPTFTGTPLAPTASVDTDTTQIATTAFVLGQASDDNPLANGSVSPGTSERYSRKDHVHPASGGTSTWTEITDFTATPASTSTITTTSDLTGSIAIRTPLRYAIGGTTYYGIVTAITSNLMTIAGAPLSSTITSLYSGDVARVKTDVIVVNGYYADASNTTLIESDLFMKGGFIWTNAKAYIVEVLYVQAANDSGATQPKINFTIASSDLLTADASISTTLANSVVNINSANYDVNFGEAIEIDVTKGTNGDAHDLTVYYVAVFP